MKKVKSEETKLDKVVKKSKVLYYMIGAIGMLVSLGIMLAFWLPKKSRKIESVTDCPDEIIPYPVDDDETEEEEVEEL